MDKRELILEATLQLVLQEGFYHLNMKKVAKAAQVAAGTIYLYFASKEALIMELYRYVMHLYLAAISDASAEQDVVARLQNMTRKYLQFFLQRPDCFSFLRQFRFSPFAFKDKETHMALLEPIYAKMELARGHDILRQLPTSVLFSLLLGPIYEAMTMWQAGELDLQETAVQEQLLAACWGSILSPAVAAG